jgi:hypothetical protein
MKRAWLSLIILAGIGGFYFLFVAAQYLFNYFSEPANPLRREYLQGIALSLVFATPFWLAVSAFAYPLRKALPRSGYIALNIPSIMLVVGILLSTIVPVLIYALGVKP